MDAATHTEEIGSLSGNVRAYLAGTGATGALIAGAVVVFLALAAFVAFNGLPLGGSGSSEGSVAVGQSTLSGAPESAALAVGGASRAVSATAAGPVVTGPPGPSPSSTALTGASGADTTGLFGTQSGTTQTPVTTDPTGGSIGDVVNTIDPGLGDATSPITGPADSTARDTLNTAGGALGNPTLGDDTVNGVNQVSDSLLGTDGTASSLLP